jgi:drug/metabolite transporter (DMT)-like permease
MPVEVTLAVLAAALAHAGWNAMIKSSKDPLLDMTLITFLAGVAVLPFLPFVAPPARASWPYLAGSIILHVGYYFAVVGAYRTGDLSHGYPIMRGLAPLLTSVCAIAWLGETPQPLTWLGILLISGGVLSLGLAGFHWRDSRRSTQWALANAVIIAGYTLVDAAGVRLSESPVGYVLWLFVLDALPFPLIILLMKKRELVEYGKRFWLRGFAGAVLSAGAYGVALWAMTRAPVAAVAALRETSVIFAALIGAWLLREGHVRRRVLGALIVASGVVALKA